MKSLLLAISLLTATTALADDSAAGLYLKAGRESCGLKLQALSAYQVSSPSSFQKGQYPPGPPPTNYTVVSLSEFYSQGALECGSAATALVKNPQADWACVISYGPPSAAVIASGAAKALNDAALQTLKSCVSAVNYTVDCFGWSQDYAKDVACFSRN